ncbi:MAG: glutathione transferase GstA [Betaproteobacteria bacterium]|nr:glutathione transferase GstA [Betaproteobacteria bacterium]
MKLYFSPGACSLSPHIALREAGLPFELVKVDLRAKKTADGRDYLAVNPKGSVPALEMDDGQVLTEGPAIVQYIADLAPAANLAPKAGTMERYRLQEWLNYLTSEVHKTFGSAFAPNMPEEWKKVVMRNVEKRMDYLAKALESKPFLMGEQFSVADGYLFTMLGWTRFINLDLNRWPALAAYAGRCCMRPKVLEAMRAEGMGG